jgi:hypothetical protein
MTRRSVLHGALATAAVAAARPVLAQQMQTHLPPGVAPKPKGPLVFLDYDKDEIDFAFDQAPWAPNQGEVAKRNAQRSAATLARLGPPRRVAYGSADIEKLDIYATKQPNAPINIFIHGGAWRNGDAKSVAYMSETFVDAGAHFVALDFNSVTDVDGNLSIMADRWYNPRWHYDNQPEVREALDLIFSDHFSRREPGVFAPLRDTLLTHHYYMHLADLESYLEADRRLCALYADPRAWARKAILNVASSGKFSSDRTIAEYAADIWHAGPCPVS